LKIVSRVLKYSSRSIANSSRVWIVSTERSRDECKIETNCQIVSRFFCFVSSKTQFVSILYSSRDHHHHHIIMQHHWSDHLTNQRWLDCEGKGLDDEFVWEKQGWYRDSKHFNVLNSQHEYYIIVKRKQQSTTLKMEKERANTELKLMTQYWVLWGFFWSTNEWGIW
jgi:hypothetical protein